MSKPAPVPAALPRVRAQQSRGKKYFLIALMALLAVGGVWKWFASHPSIDISDTNEILAFGGLVLLPLGILSVLYHKLSHTHDPFHERLGYQMSLDQLQKRLRVQENFLQVITDHETENIIIFDKDNHFWFANASAAKSLKRDPKEIVGLPPAHVFDHVRARQIITRLENVRRSMTPIDVLEKIQDVEGHVRYTQAHYKILDEFDSFTGGVLFREEDVTNLVVERERRENMLRQVLAALVAVIDRRDPYAAGHSSRVGQLSRMIAEEMVLPERMIETAEIAGSLMNFGKVLVSREILTKTTALTVEELQRVRDSILTSADILSVIDFPTPVIPTLKQVLEHVDGGGIPQCLRGDQIIVTARIVSVANSYVALVSPRAHRPSIGLKEAIEYLTRDVDRIYDRSVVKALSQFVDNRSNKLDWLTASKQN